jgi:hypothetical protein
LLFFLEASFAVATGREIGAAFADVALLAAIVGAERLTPPPSPTAEATANSAFGAAGCGISISFTGGGGNAKLGGIPGGRKPGGIGGMPDGKGAPIGNGGGGGGGGGMGAIIFTGSSMKQSSLSVKSSYPCAATRAKAERMEASIAASRVLPRPQDRKVPAIRMPKLKGLKER